MKVGHNLPSYYGTIVGPENNINILTARRLHEMSLLRLFFSLLAVHIGSSFRSINQCPLRQRLFHLYDHEIADVGPKHLAFDKAEEPKISILTEISDVPGSLHEVSVLYTTKP